MPYILEYLLKFSISLGVLYIFYQLVLRPLTFYQWNRFYLLCYSLLSFFIPFININSWIDSFIEEGHLLKSIPVFENLTSQIGATIPSDPKTSVTGAWNIALLVICIGMGLMLARLIIQYLSLQKLRRNAILVYDNGISLYDVASEIGPFSFGKSIFVNSQLHTEEELQKIIRHEFVHVKQKHSVDMMIGEFICMVNWFNPFAWLIRKAIRQNLEFIADHNVLQTGLDMRQYQYLLLKVIGFPQYSITNNFNFSSLKKRIAMMNKMKTARVHLVKFLFVLPMLAVVLLAFREKMSVKKESLIASQIAAVINHTDTIPVPPPPPPLPEGVKRISINDREAIVVLKNGTKETYDLNKPAEKASFESRYGKIHPPPPPKPPVAPEKEEVEIVPATPGRGAMPSAPVIPVAPVAPAMPKNVKSIRMDSRITVTLKDGTNESYDLGKPAERARFEKKYPALLPPPPPPFPAVEPVEPVEPVEVSPVVNVSVNEKEVLSEVKINTNTNNNITSEVNVSENINISASSGVNISRFRDFGGLIIINGKESTKEALSKIDPATIKEVNVLKGESATIQYKEKGKKGVLIIITK